MWWEEDNMDAKKQEIMHQYDRVAHEYDQSKACQFALQSYPYVLNTLIPMNFNNVLDVGCGTGTLLQKILDEKPQVKAYGLDLSEEMLVVAKGKLPKRVELVCGEAESLPYDNKRFDLVIMVDSLRYFASPDQAVKEAYRVLKPGGTLIVCDMLLTGLKKLFGEKNTHTEVEVRLFLQRAGFDVINLMRNIQDGYIATGDKR